MLFPIQLTTDPTLQFGDNWHKQYILTFSELHLGRTRCYVKLLTVQDARFLQCGQVLDVDSVFYTVRR